MNTKLQQRREDRYRAQLRRCGFRSWVRANARRFRLIASEIWNNVASPELGQLQKLADLYVAWKTNGLLERESRRIQAMWKRLGQAGLSRRGDDGP